MSLFEKEQPFTIKQIWNKYYEEKPTALGLDISGGEMNIILKKYHTFLILKCTIQPLLYFSSKKRKRILYINWTKSRKIICITYFINLNILDLYFLG